MDEVSYTPEELAEKTLLAYYRCLATEIVLTGMIASLPESILLMQPLTPDKAKAWRDQLLKEIPQEIQTCLLYLCSFDSSFSAERLEQLRQGKGLFFDIP